MFAAAMDRVTTENGRPSLATTGDPRLDAFAKLVRGLSQEGVEAHANAMMEKQDDPDVVVDAFVLWASTRDVRGGKGERDLARWQLLPLASRYPATVEALVPLVPEYGCWRDVVDLLETPRLPQTLRRSLISLMVAQLETDRDAEKPSLCAKWAPRPKSAHKAVAKLLAKGLFPDQEHPLPSYRKMLAEINGRIAPVEIKMCAGKWAQIEPGKVPAKCLTVHNDAFQNRTRSHQLRRPEDADRIECAQRFAAHAELVRQGLASMHGRVMHPHELAKPYLDNPAEQTNLISEAQWKDMSARIGQEFSAVGKMVPLVDVSGSMAGRPMHVAISLGILLSEISRLKDRFLTFSSTPMWHHLQPDWTLCQKVGSARRAQWGMSTDFQKAIEMILDACVLAGLPPEEMTDLSMLVLSDMQFDAARGATSWSGKQTPSWQTQHEQLVKTFEAAGLRSKWKQPYPVPRIIYWNLRGDTTDYVATADTPGVQMLSGFSPNLLKAVMHGELDADCVGDNAPVDPMTTLRRVLDDPRYDPVRDKCSEVGEGVMAAYKTSAVV
jgi:hypothetical protein